MKTITLALFALALTAPALADTAPAAPAEKAAYVCYYNAAGKLTSAKPLEPGAFVPKNFTTTGRGGDETWSYSVKSTDGSDCPKRVRS
jgi:hypothetical protein